MLPLHLCTFMFLEPTEFLDLVPLILTGTNAE